MGIAPRLLSLIVHRMVECRGFPAELLRRVFLLAIANRGPQIIDDPQLLALPDVCLDEHVYLADELEQIRVTKEIVGQRRQLLAISAVSSTWRAIALDYSVLWSTILITPRTSLVTVGAFLERSHGVALNVVFDIRRYFANGMKMPADGDPVHVALVAVMDRISVDLPRCHSLSITTYFDTDMVLLLQLLPSRVHASELEQLRLCHIDSVEGSDGWRLFPEMGLVLDNAIFRSTPKLARFRSFGMTSSPHVMVSLVRNLTSVNFRDVAEVSWSDVVGVIVRSPQLVKLSLWCLAGGEAPPFADELRSDLIASQLKVLSIGDVEILFAVALLRHVRFPALRSLTLCFDEEDVGVASGVAPSDLLCLEMVRVTNRCEGPVVRQLVDLDVSGFCPSIESAARLWAQVRSLSTLTIRGCPEMVYGLIDVMEGFLEQRLWTDGALGSVRYEGAPAPRLRYVVFSGVEALAINMFAVLRGRVGLSLASFTVVTLPGEYWDSVRHVSRFADTFEVKDV